MAENIRDKWPPDAFLVSGIGVHNISESAFETIAESIAGSDLALTPIWRPSPDMLPILQPDYIDDEVDDEPFILHATFTNAGVELGYRRSYVSRLGGGLVVAARQIEALKARAVAGEPLANLREQRRLQSGVTFLRILNTNEIPHEEWDLPVNEVMISVRGVCAAVLDKSIRGEKGFGEASIRTLEAISRRFIKPEHLQE